MSTAPAPALSEPVVSVVRGTSAASLLALGLRTVSLCPVEIARALCAPVDLVIRELLRLGSAEVHIGGGVVVSWDDAEALLIVTAHSQN